MMKFSTSANNPISIRSELVNDVHSQLNPTLVKKRILAKNVSDVIAAVKAAKYNGDYICVAGGRHAMGGQQFLKDGLLIDMSALNKTIHFDPEKGLIEVEGGIMWPDLIDDLQRQQIGRTKQWTIIQKQTGSDQLSIGGSLSANGHGRGLRLAPIVDNIEEICLAMHDGQLIKCSRQANSELFALAIGGYGLFGVIVSATLRLMKRTKLLRIVEVIKTGEAIDKLEEYKTAGATYGDFQFAIDHNSPDFLNKGILSTYKPVEGDNEPSPNNKLLSAADWFELLNLAHNDKTAAFEKYMNHYLSTNGQLYWSDTFQLSTYFKNYHERLDKQNFGYRHGSEIITELYVPRNKLGLFMEDAAQLLRDHDADIIYGTVRIIEKDSDTFLPWARQPYACIVFNLHVEHSPYQIVLAERTFCALIDLAIEFDGSYFLTYHRFATASQFLTCYPKMPQFIKRKFHYDPQGLFRSDWAEHYFRLLG